MATDLLKVFEIYWLLGNLHSLPPVYPNYLETQYNITHRASLQFNGETIKMYFASSPLKFNTPQRTNDMDAIIGSIDRATTYLFASVMDYSPTTLYQPPSTAEYWGLLDDAFRRAAFRGVTVNILFGVWDHTDNRTYQYMKSLNQLENIVVKVIVIPQFSITIPYSRVDHSKFLVTDSEAYITTSNWTPDYFLQTGGVSITLSESTSKSIVEEIVRRDWLSQYTLDLNVYLNVTC
eukprot:TRINITY_DN2035_c0_g1_i2.p1 TRINITY_DN2035_c0_g1~~TRINITY_DN2035_c0_g1_i2.p1  ORF type:complete len:235 (+),score=26.46 TRINITY_DN2035_c0_g1_i2:647-1351(+)